jgi:hypothetical protein
LFCKLDVFEGPTLPQPLPRRVGDRTARPALMAAVLLCVVLTGCQTTRSTRLTIGDLNHVVAEMEAKLLASDFVQDRGPDSPRAIIVINKVQNLTDDVISPGEQWMMMARVRAKLAGSQLRRIKNITFQIAPERFELLRQSGFDGDLGPTDPPTHAMTAAFRSATRTVVDPKTGFANRREDYFYIEYAIQDLQTRDIVWTDKVEFKREAKGLVID